MKFYTAESELVFENPAQYPAQRPVELMQVRERSAAGTSHVETYSSPIPRRALMWNSMGQQDYINVLDWFLNIAQGMQNPFWFEDERGDVFYVRFEDRTINLKEVTFERYTGSLNLEILNA